jgi:D-3-phosphoglycerate dehydrogenase / 2-oxoglutarate reductase
VPLHKKIAFLTPTVPALREEMRSLLPDGFAIDFAQTNTKECHRQLLVDADYVFLGASYLDRELIEGAPKLKFIQKWGIGIDKIDVQAAKDRGIPVAITNGSNSAQVAEQTILLMLATLRRLSYAQKAFRAGQWPNAELRTTCLQLSQKTVGLFGFGNIAKQVVKQLQGFDVNILYYSRTKLSSSIENQFGVEYVNFDQLLKRSDVLSLHAPLNEDTRNIISAQALAQMKSSAIIVNTARGELIDENALTQALQSGHLMGAGLDVFQNEPPDIQQALFHLDNVVVTPHAGASVKEAVTKIVQHGMRNIAHFDQGLDLDPADIIQA